jgi:hypothetical protein
VEHQIYIKGKQVKVPEGYKLAGFCKGNDGSGFFEVVVSRDEERTGPVATEKRTHSTVYHFNGEGVEIIRVEEMGEWEPVFDSAAVPFDFKVKR